MPRSCPSCLAEWETPLPPGSKCPECRARLPGGRDDGDEEDRPRPRRREDDEDDRDEDRPRRRRRDEDDDDFDEPPRRRPARKSGGAGRVLLIVGGVFVGLVVLCCGGYGLFMAYGPKPVKVLDASRTPTAEGGTGTVSINVRVGGSGPGGMVRGDYYFNFKAGDRTSVHNVGLIGRDGGEFRQVFLTPELAKEPGPVTFWVERRDGSSVSRVSDYHTIK